jgi:hypothetical protein
MARTDRDVNLKALIGNQLQYIYSADELTNVLNTLASNIAVPAGFRRNQMLCFADTSKDNRRAKRYRMHKKHGGTRAIVAPHQSLLYMLKGFNALLQQYYEPTTWCYGFVKGCSVVQNAQQHLGKRYILNIDIKDFFPSITRQMVEDVLLAEPLKCSAEAARLLSGLCTAAEPQGDVLPQGFPTSPTLSNMVCKKMDEELAAAAQRIGATYSRYADDMSFSSDKDVLRPTGSFYLQVSTIVEKYGFRLNDRKTRLQRRGRRQQVTGVVVSHKVNVTREYARQIRSLLYMWERYGYWETARAALRAYREQHGKTRGHGEYLTLYAVLRGRLNYMKMVKGETDPTYLKLWNKYNQLMQRDVPKRRRGVYGTNAHRPEPSRANDYLGEPQRKGCAGVVALFVVLTLAGLLACNLLA